MNEFMRLKRHYNQMLPYHLHVSATVGVYVLVKYRFLTGSRLNPAKGRQKFNIFMLQLREQWSKLKPQDSMPRLRACLFSTFSGIHVVFFTIGV